MKFVPSITDRKIRQKLLKEEKLYVPKVVEQLQRNTYDRKKKKSTIPDGLISNRIKKLKEEPIHKITHSGRYGTRPKERRKERNCRYCGSPNWNPNHKCSNRKSVCHNFKKIGHYAKACKSEYRKRQRFDGIAEPEDTEESCADKSINIRSKTNTQATGKNYNTMTIKMTEQKKNFSTTRDLRSQQYRRAKIL